LSDTLDVSVSGLTDTVSYKVPLTTTGWLHQWVDVSAWGEPTVTLRIELATPDKDRTVGVVLDELTWGSSIIGSHPIYLPIIRH
jgi:hypothetical protein